uniref:Uncharacterized protein n=1 Tax=Knipowitschia caucasica TaxID=637954 RepID=A0AAV2KXJ2_KNICA
MADRTQTLHPTIVSDGHGAAEQKQRNTLMHGGQFAHFTKKGKQIVNGCLSPIFRLKRKRQPTEETNQRPWTMNNQCKAKMTEIVQQTQLKACMKGSSSIREGYLNWALFQLGNPGGRGQPFTLRTSNWMRLSPSCLPSSGRPQEQDSRTTGLTSS